MADTDPHAERIAALEQRQRRLSRQIRWLLIIAVLLTAFACWQQQHNRWLIAQHERVIEMMRLMQPVEPAEQREPPTAL